MHTDDIPLEKYHSVSRDCFIIAAVDLAKFSRDPAEITRLGRFVCDYTGPYGAEAMMVVRRDKGPAEFAVDTYGPGGSVASPSLDHLRSVGRYLLQGAGLPTVSMKAGLVSCSAELEANRNRRAAPSVSLVLHEKAISETPTIDPSGSCRYKVRWGPAISEAIWIDSCAATTPEALLECFMNVDPFSATSLSFVRPISPTRIALRTIRGTTAVAAATEAAIAAALCTRSSDGSADTRYVHADGGPLKVRVLQRQGRIVVRAAAQAVHIASLMLKASELQKHLTRYEAYERVYDSRPFSIYDDELIEFQSAFEANKSRLVQLGFPPAPSW